MAVFKALVWHCRTPSGSALQGGSNMPFCCSAEWTKIDYRVHTASQCGVSLVQGHTDPIS